MCYVVYSYVKIEQQMLDHNNTTTKKARKMIKKLIDFVNKKMNNKTKKMKRVYVGKTLNERYKTYDLAREYIIYAKID